MAISPHPWKWIEAEAGEGANERLVDANGEEICNFGISEQWYPTAGSAPGPDDSRVIKAAPRLLAACVQVNEFLTSLMKAVPWGQTFDLDIAGLNHALCELPKAIAEARGNQ